MPKPASSAKHLPQYFHPHIMQYTSYSLQDKYFLKNAVDRLYLYPKCLLMWAGFPILKKSKL